MRRGTLTVAGGVYYFLFPGSALNFKFSLQPMAVLCEVIHIRRVDEADTESVQEDKRKNAFCFNRSSFNP
ncbi:hypothetical protein KCP73_06715 [Salmonella enterica subsp. enterica]|nr:hypothetical protein KCP73_06715 [Salmonella enterica subsp. enterica]